MTLGEIAHLHTLRVPRPRRRRSCRCSIRSGIGGITTTPRPGCTICTGTGLPGYNMYAYCNNNPVMGYDPNGNMIIHNPRMFSTMDLFMKFLYGERSLYAINILYKKM